MHIINIIQGNSFLELFNQLNLIVCFRLTILLSMQLMRTKNLSGNWSNFNGTNSIIREYRKQFLIRPFNFTKYKLRNSFQAWQTWREEQSPLCHCLKDTKQPYQLKIFFFTSNNPWYSPIKSSLYAQLDSISQPCWYLNSHFSGSLRCWFFLLKVKCKYFK